MQSYLYQIIKPSCRGSWIWNNSPSISPEVETTLSLEKKKKTKKNTIFLSMTNLFFRIDFNRKWLLLLLMYPEIYPLPKILWIPLHLFHLKIVFIINKSFSSFSNSDILSSGTLTTLKLFVLSVNNGSTKIFASFFLPLIILLQNRPNPYLKRGLC